MTPPTSGGEFPILSLWTWRRGIRFRMRVTTPHQTRIHVSLSLNTIESLFDLVNYGFWSGEATPGVRRPVTIPVRTAYSIAATWSILHQQERGQAVLRSAGARRLRKTLRRCPAGAKSSLEKYLVDLGRDTRTSTQSRRLVRRKDASWSLNWPSGANLLAQKQHMYFLLVPLWLKRACFSLLLGEY